MSTSQYYEKVDGDESNEPLAGERRSRVVRAPPTATKKRSTLGKLAIGAVAATIFVAAVGIISSAVVSYRLSEAVEVALAKQNSTATTADSGFNEMGGTKHTETVKTGIVSDDTLLAPFKGQKHQDMADCGRTAAEAKAAGCIFDIMVQLWTPPACMDTPLMERSLAAGNWSWYANGDATEEMSVEEVKKGEHSVVFVTQSFHRHSCIYAWERAVRAVRNQTPLIEHLTSVDHVMNCRHKTLSLPDEGGEQEDGVIATVGFTKCASWDVWLDNLPFDAMADSY